MIQSTDLRIPGYGDDGNHPITTPTAVNCTPGSLMVGFALNATDRIRGLRPICALVSRWGDPSAPESQVLTYLGSYRTITTSIPSTNANVALI